VPLAMASKVIEKICPFVPSKPGFKITPSNKTLFPRNFGSCVQSFMMLSSVPREMACNKFPGKDTVPETALIDCPPEFTSTLTTNFSPSVTCAEGVLNSKVAVCVVVF